MVPNCPTINLKYLFLMMTIMAKHKFLQCLTVVSLGGLLGLSLTAAPGFSETANAAEETETSESSETSNSSLRQGLPGRRLGGGTRAPEMAAYNDQKPLVALIPENNLSVTTADHPTLLFHLPVVDTSQNVEFVLYDSSDKLLYQTQFNVAGSSGIAGIDLSSAEGLDPLTVNETYQWYFTIVADDRSQDISVDGWLQRVTLDEWAQRQSLSPDLLADLNMATPLEQVRLLHQEASLWSDAALVLHQLRKRDPHNGEVVAAWQDLLQTVGLSELSEEPIAELSIEPVVH